MHLSSLGFGILLLLQAALAQSAPRLSFSDDADEEELIDRLALFTGASNRINAFEQPRDFETGAMPALDYVSSMDGLGYGKPDLSSLPRQFAYPPSDPRFFMAVPQFSNDYEQQNPQQPGGRYYKSDVDTIMNEVDQPEGSQPLRPSTLDETIRIFNDAERVLRGDASGDFHYMKKNRMRQEPSATNEEDGVMSHISPNSNADRRSNIDLKSPRVIPASQPDVSEDSTNPGPTNKNKTQSPYETYHSNPSPSNIMKSSNDADAPGYVTTDNTSNSGFPSFYYVAIIAGCSAAAVVGVIGAGICWYRIHERVKAAADVDYPAYGVTGPSKDVSPSGGDRKLAQSAHMYHYQHQKQQMAALAKSPTQGERQGSGGSDVESEDDNEDGDYTVYECPGLAGLCNTGEIEVKNPLYEDEPTPASPQVLPTSEESQTAQK